MRSQHHQTSSLIIDILNPIFTQQNIFIYFFVDQRMFTAMSPAGFLLFSLSRVRLPREVNCIIKALGLLINRHFIRNARKCLAIEFQMKMSTLVSISDWDFFADWQLQMRVEKLCVRRTIGVGK